MNSNNDQNNLNDAIFEEDDASEILTDEPKSESKKKAKKKKSRRKRYEDMNSGIWKRVLCSILACACIVAVFFAAGKITNLQNNNGTVPLDGNGSGAYSNQNNGTAPDSLNVSGLAVSLPYISEPVQISNGTAVTLCEFNSTGTHLIANINDLVNKTNVTESALNVTLNFEVANIPEGIQVDGVVVDVSENSDFSDCRSINAKTTDSSVEIDYLKANTKYYYRVKLVPTDYAACGSFTTADTVRLLNIPGLVNVRDIGNWKTTDGKTIKQGLLYRGTELDGQVSDDDGIDGTYLATEKGISDMKEILGIKTDMDLRSPTDNASGVHPLGDTVSHIFYNATSYELAFTEDGMANMKTIFTDLADRNKYPIYLHCTYGMDRTGSVCFILEALLGMDYDSLRKEYALSMLTHKGSAGKVEILIQHLDQYPGETVSEKAENYLLTAGLNQFQINNIKRIFLSGT